MIVNDDRKAKSPPPPVLNAQPEKQLEQELKRNPKDLDIRADVGSDESMDASDPSSATQPGQKDEPAPSSSYPEKSRDE